MARVTMQTTETVFFLELNEVEMALIAALIGATNGAGYDLYRPLIDAFNAHAGLTAEGYYEECVRAFHNSEDGRWFVPEPPK